MLRRWSLVSQAVGTAASQHKQALCPHATSQCGLSVRRIAPDSLLTSTTTMAVAIKHLHFHGEGVSGPPEHIFCTPDPSCTNGELQIIPKEVQSMRTEVQSMKAREAAMTADVESMKAREAAMTADVESMKAREAAMTAEVESMKVKEEAMRTEVQCMKAEMQFVTHEKTVPKEQIIHAKEQDIRGMSDRIFAKEQDIRGMSDRIFAKEQDIRVVSGRIFAKEQDIQVVSGRIFAIEQEVRVMAQCILAKQQEIRVAEQRNAPVTYATALAWSTSAALVFPNTDSVVRIGRRAFDERLATIFAHLMQQTTMEQQHSVSVVLQCASGVGKTFACNTFRRGQLTLNPSAPFVPFCVYLGLSQGFPLTPTEIAAISDGNDCSLMSVLYQRLAFLLKSILDAVNQHRDALDPFSAALDGEHGEWVQKLPFPEDEEHYKHRCVEPSNDTSCIMELLSQLRSVAKKRLAILVCLDEGQTLDELSPFRARIALRCLRRLQKMVFNNTRREVLLLPIIAGIDADVTLSSQTEGSNVVFGANDEALMNFEDFKSLLRVRMIEEIERRNNEGKHRITTDVSPRFLTLLAAAHYPHVRQMLRSPTTVTCATGSDIATDTQAMAIVKAAFMKAKIDLRACGFPVGRIPVHLTEETTGIPVLSFLHWRQVHERLFPGNTVSIPTEVVNETWFTYSTHWASFELRCFTVLSYFFAIFGPVKKSELTSTTGSGLRGPLAEWICVPEFRLCTLQNGGVLSNPQGQYNPFSCPNKKGHRHMIRYPLTSEFTAMLEQALSEARSAAAARAVWVTCGGSAPIDYILIVFTASGNQQATVDMRFADAKHTNTSSTQPNMSFVSGKARALHLALAYHIKRFVSKELVAVSEFKESHVMLCHNADNSTMFSPSTFEWRPWSDFLFCDSPSENSRCEESECRATPIKGDKYFDQVCASFANLMDMSAKSTSKDVQTEAIVGQ